MNLMRLFLLGLIAAIWLSPAARAQEAGRVWLQIEALPTLAEAEDRARAYTGVFPDVVGFQLRSGWYGILIGPYDAGTAPQQMASLKAERLIPADSYLNDGTSFRLQFWPVGLTGTLEDPAVQGPTVEPVETAPLPDATPVDPVEPAVTDPAPPVIPDETPAEARDSERLLERPSREALQTALQWFGFYTSTIDGAFGPGTRESMAAWQSAAGYEVTGILTTQQRTKLLKDYNDALAVLGLEVVTEPEAGIEIILPMAMVKFDHYEPPFVHYAEKDGSGVRVILISQPGDQTSLYGLYDILQTLEVVPLTGERERLERSFTIRGRSAEVESYSYAALSGGLVKGYMLIWDPREPGQIDRVLDAMQKSFKPVGDRALDPGLVPMPDEQRRGLLSGLEVRRPGLSRTGFFVDADGAVMTTAEATEDCSRITLDLETEADVLLTDAATGIAVLRPKAPLSPRSVAGLAAAPGRLGSEVAVSGYSYEDQLPAPTLTFGTFEEPKGLNGETGVSRLTMEALPGDAGGPVLDAAGTVLGLLLPRDADGSRQLPASVQYAASASVLNTLLSRAGITPPLAETRGALAPEDLNRVAEGMTVLVSCWK